VFLVSRIFVFDLCFVLVCALYMSSIGVLCMTLLVCLWYTCVRFCLCCIVLKQLCLCFCVNIDCITLISLMISLFEPPLPPLLLNQIHKYNHTAHHKPYTINPKPSNLTPNP